MSQKQVRISDRLYQELDEIAKKRHSSLTDTLDWVLQFKVDNVTLADTKPGAKNSDDVTKKMAEEAFSQGYQAGWLHGSSIEQTAQMQEKIIKRLDEVAAAKKTKPVWPHS